MGRRAYGQPKDPVGWDLDPGDAAKMNRTALVRIGLIVVAIGAITLGLNLMNVRDNAVLLAGAVVTIGGFVLGGIQLWGFYKGIEK
jgi:hypothetical protein